MDTKNFAIGVLSTTAVVLFVGLILIHTRPQPAYGNAMNAQGGDYVLITGQLQRNEEESPESVRVAEETVRGGLQRGPTARAAGRNRGPRVRREPHL